MRSSSPPGPGSPTLLGPVAGLELGVPRQEVIYIATPPGDPSVRRGDAPDLGRVHSPRSTALPSIEGRGFKVAPDWPGPMVDPDRQERRLCDELVAGTRDYLRRRFPALADQPVAEGRVCQYEVTPDTHFIIDRHPGIDNAWIVGGGSGHGFKHGPVVGEYVSALVVGDAAAVAELEPGDGRFQLGHREVSPGVRTSAGGALGQLSSASASAKRA